MDYVEKSKSNINELYNRLINIKNSASLKEEVIDIKNNSIDLVYSEIEQDYLEFLRKSKYNCSLDCISDCINFSVRERDDKTGKYLYIKIKRNNKIYGSDGHIEWGGLISSREFIIVEDLSIYEVEKEKLVPLAYYYLSKQYLIHIGIIKNYILEILNFLSEKNNNVS